MRGSWIVGVGMGMLVLLACGPDAEPSDTGAAESSSSETGGDDPYSCIEALDNGCPDDAPYCFLVRTGGCCGPGDTSCPDLCERRCFAECGDDQTDPNLQCVQDSDCCPGFTCGPQDQCEG